jgi:hypothetical protein
MKSITHTLSIDLDDALEEELDGVLGEIEGFLDGLRERSWRIPPLRVVVDIPELLAKSRSVALIWTVEDVLAQRPDLGDDQAWQVLRHAAEHIERDMGLKARYLKEYALQLFGPLPGMTYAVAMSLHAVCHFPDSDAKFDYQCFLTDGRCVLVRSEPGTHSVIPSTLTSDDVPHVVPLDQVPPDVYAILARAIAA